MDFKSLIPPYISINEKTSDEIALKLQHLAALSEDLPVFIIHELINDSVVYMSEKGLAQLGTTLEEVRSIGSEYYNRFFNKEEVGHYLVQWQYFKKDPSNHDNWFTIFQQVNIKEKETPIWHLSASRIIAFDEKTKKPLLSLTLSLVLNQHTPITPKLDRLVKENHFLRTNIHLYSQLTKKEKEVLQLMAYGLSVKDITEQLHISETTTRTHRKNIKRKLQIRNDVELMRFASAYNLV
jgi:DNA-binding CsgD family transcriptional regulator/predicted transcriptional regulator